MEKSHTLTLSISKLIKNLDFKPIATKPNAIYHDYTGVSFKSIFSIEGSCPCDVFISIHKGEHTRIIKENDIVDHLRLMKYQKKGIRQLYIRRSDRRKFVSYSANILDQFIADDFCYFLSFEPTRKEQRESHTHSQ